MNSVLLRAVRVLVRADSSPARQALFGRLRQSNGPARFAYGLHARLGRGRASAFFVSLYGLATFLKTVAPTSGRLLGVAVHANAKRELARVARWFGSGEMQLLSTQAGNMLKPSVGVRVLALIKARQRVRQYLRIMTALNRRYDFLVSCRVAGVIASHARGVSILGGRDWAAVLVSTDTNPEEAGFLAAARGLGIPTIFIGHAQPNPFSPPLDFSLSILGGEAALKVRRTLGRVSGRVFFVGLEGESVPIDTGRLTRPRPRIGIFCSKVVAWPQLASLVSECTQLFQASQIVLRWHPSMMEPSQLGQFLDDRSGVVVSAPTDSLQEVVARCDWVIADLNSNVHLPVLKLGVPTVAVRGLGITAAGRTDLCGFEANGIIPPPVSSLGQMSLPDVIAHFSEGWKRRMGFYDASYLRSPAAMEREAREAIERVLAEARRG